jgi:transcriptional regulator with XRE-family HTH domain
MNTSTKNRRPRAPKGPPGPINEVLADNLRRIIEHEGLNQTSWAARHGAEKKQVQRALRVATSPTLDTLAAIATAANLQPWQLLIPKLDPANPPVFTMTKAERDLYSRLKREFLSLPSPNGGN